MVSRRPAEPGAPGASRWSARSRAGHLDVVGVVALGGALGSLARWGVAAALPHGPAGFPWGTWLVNVTGALLMGVLVVIVLERWATHRYARPFLGSGVLGGYTTFSTYAVDVHGLVAADEPVVAGSYLVSTLVIGLVAVYAGMLTTRAVLRLPPLLARRRAARAGRRDGAGYADEPWDDAGRHP